MKKQLFLYILFIMQFIVPVCAYSDESKLLVTGSMQFPSAVVRPPSLKVLYQGYKYPVEVCDEIQRAHRKAHFELYVDSNSNELYIIVAENLQIPDQNNFEHLKTSLDFSYRMFKLKKYEIVPDAEGDVRKLSWSIEELPSEKHEVTLPDNTLIFFMPPSMIVKLEEDPWPADQHVARLPRIIFNEAISDQELQDAATRMTLALLDFELFHAQLPKRFMIGDSRIVAMPYLQPSART